MKHIEGIVVVDCPECGMHFGITESFYKRRTGDGGSFCCPSGHYQSFGDTREDELKREVERLRQSRDDAQETRANCWNTISELRASRSALRGVITRMKNEAK